MRRVEHPRLAALAVLVALGLGLAAVSYGASASPGETYAQLLTQIDSRSVTTAIVNRIGHDVKVTLQDSSSFRAVYPSRQERQLVARLKAHGAHVKYTRRKKAAVHHTLRYIGGAIVIVVIAAGGGMFLYTRRRGARAGS